MQGARIKDLGSPPREGVVGGAGISHNPATGCKNQSAAIEV